MKKSLVTRTLEAVSQKEPVALVTELSTGKKAIAYPNMMHGEFSLPTPVFEKVRQRVDSDRSGLVEDGETRLFVQCFLPPKRLVIVGGIYIAPHLSKLAQMTGFKTTIVEPRGELITNVEQFGMASLIREPVTDALSSLNLDSRSAVVTLSHDPRIDDPALHQALKSEAFFIGSMGSKKAHTARIERLSQAGFSIGDIGRIHNPLGVGLSAGNEAELALSVLSQIVATLRGGSVVTTKKKS